MIGSIVNKAEVRRQHQTIRQYIHWHTIILPDRPFTPKRILFNTAELQSAINAIL